MPFYLPQSGSGTGIVTVVPWTPLALNAGVTDGLYGLGPARFLRDAFGVVWLAGAISNGAGHVATLPEGSRPEHIAAFPVITAGPGAVELSIGVEPDGKIYVNGVLEEFAVAHLDSIAFRTVQDSAGPPPSESNGITPNLIGVDISNPADSISFGATNWTTQEVIDYTAPGNEYTVIVRQVGFEGGANIDTSNQREQLNPATGGVTIDTSFLIPGDEYLVSVYFKPGDGSALVSPSNFTFVR